MLDKKLDYIFHNLLGQDPTCYSNPNLPEGLDGFQPFFPHTQSSRPPQTKPPSHSNQKGKIMDHFTQNITINRCMSFAMSFMYDFMFFFRCLSTLIL